MTSTAHVGDAAGTDELVAGSPIVAITNMRLEGSFGLRSIPRDVRRVRDGEEPPVDPF
jgi:hypothetical protein